MGFAGGNNTIPAALLTSVTKTYEDIVSDEIALYTLEEDQALVNVYTDVTTVFSGARTACTIGDSADNDGWQQASDWTASGGTGLTNATRGAYVTNFKGMRSTSGETNVVVYLPNSSEFVMDTGGDARTISNGGTREELAQQFNTGAEVIGKNVTSASWFLKIDQGSPDGDIQAFIRQSDGTIRETSSTTLDASTVAATSTEYAFTFAGTTEMENGDMICITLDNGTGGSSNSINCVTATTSLVANLKLFQTSSPGSSYSEISSEQMKMKVAYAGAAATQGQFTCYLQIAS